MHILRTLSTLILCTAVLTLGCSDSGMLDSGSEEPSTAVKPGNSNGAVSTSSATSFVVEEVGFAFPESAAYDEKSDTYLISNLGPGSSTNPATNLFTLDNNGFITRLDAQDGSVQTLKWIEGGSNGVTLHAPTGITVFDETLYVVDRNALRMFDLETGSPAGSVSLPSSVSLPNDVCTDPTGTLYVTDTGLNADLNDTGTDAVYRIEDGALTTVAEGTELINPNGCEVNGANVHIASFTSNQVYRLNQSGKMFDVGTTAAGALDGIIRVDGDLFITGWDGSAVYDMSLGGNKVDSFIEGISTPADPGYDSNRDRLIVPQLLQDRVVVRTLD